MTNVTLTFMCPVDVVIEDGVVSSVVVFDEMDTTYTEAKDNATDLEISIDSELALEAIAIADDSDWPPWQFGY